MAEQPLTDERRAEMRERVALLDNQYGCFDKLHRAFARDVLTLLAEVDRLRVLESGTQKAWTNAGAERDRARQDAAAAQAALGEAHAAAEAAQVEAAYWRRRAGRLRGAWESARRGRRELRRRLVNHRVKWDANRAEVARLTVERDGARDRLAEVRSHAERLARSGDPSCVEEGRALLDIVGPVTVAPGTPAAAARCEHRDFDDPTRCLLCHP